VGGFFFAVDDKDLTRRGFEVFEPSQHFNLVGVSAEAVDLNDIGLDGEMLAEDTHLAVGFWVHDGPSERADGLIADQQHRAFGAVDIVDQVVLNTAAGTHAGAGDNHNRILDIINGFGFLRRTNQFKPPEGKRWLIILH